MELFATLADVEMSAYFPNCDPEPIVPLMMPVRALMRLLSRGVTSGSSACPTATVFPKGPLDWPSHENFVWMSTGILAVTCIITGLGTEVVLGDLMILKLKEREFSLFWKFSQ